MQGFTLIEMSIVLVIIGLIVGGVLVGQSVIQAAEVRAQITQIEKYNSAVNTFRSKFGYLPGDMRPEIAQQYGFVVGAYCSGLLPGYRNGDGVLDGAPNSSLSQNYGETGLFWQDLSSAAAGTLIDGSFSSAGTPVICAGNPIPLISTTVGTLLPSAKIGHSNFLYVYGNNEINWFGLSNVSAINAFTALLSSANLNVYQAYNMDRKIDDGLPASGNVQAVYINTNLIGAPNTTTSGGTSSSCYDTTTGTYSITYNNGSGANCALSFKFN